jgi:hypothetical protein
MCIRCPFRRITPACRINTLVPPRLSTIRRIRPIANYVSGVAIALVLEHGAARAQLIDQYLDPNVPGYGIEPGVTVAARQHPEYDSSGIRVGAFTLQPTLDEYVGYDDNVTATATAHGSPLIETNARVEAMSAMSDASLGGSLTVDNMEYPSQSAQSYTNWTASFGGSYDFGHDTLYVAASHLNLSQTPGQLDAPQLQGAIAYRVDDGRVSYKWDLSPLTLQPAFDVSYYSYDNGSVLGVPYLQSYRDRIVYQPSLTAGYEFATRRRIVVIIRDAAAQYMNAPPGFPRESFNDASILAGVSYDTDGIVGLRLLGGYEERSFSSSAYRMIQAPIVEAGVTWTPTGLTTVTGTAARYIEDSAAEATVGYTETAFKLAIDHELYRNVILSANGGVYLDDYAQNGGNQQFYTAGVAAVWKLNRTVALGADYTYSSRQTSAAFPFDEAIPNGGVFGESYTASVFRVHLRIAI